MQPPSTTRENQRISSKRTRFSIELIEEMVHTFYRHVRAHRTLGPIFDQRIDHWPVHLDRMVRFWRAVLRSEPTFRLSDRGAPPVLHQQIEELEPSHFEEWLALFGEVVDRVWGPDEAADVKTAAQRIALALSRHLEPGTFHERRAL